MEHTQNTRKVLAAGLVLVAATVGLAGCATASPAADPGLSRALVRESADHYVDQLVERAHAVVTDRTLARESADHYVDQLVERAHASASAVDDDLSSLTGR
jgi:N-formylglutamate amidohydrolase